MLEYCSIIWNPHLLKDIEAIENVQRRFTKRLPGMQNFTYHQRLVSLSLDSLELRRIRLDLIYTYKIVFGLCDLRMTDFFSKATCLTLRGHQHRLYLPTTRNSARYNFYSHRIIGAWNSLPVEKVNFNSLNSFRNSLSSDILVYLCKLNFAWVIAVMHVRFLELVVLLCFIVIAAFIDSHMTDYLHCTISVLSWYIK